MALQSSWEGPRGPDAPGADGLPDSRVKVDSCLITCFAHSAGLILDGAVVPWKSCGSVAAAQRGPVLRSKKLATEILERFVVGLLALMDASSNHPHA